MKIAVCLKRVPDTTAKIVIAGDGVSIDPAGVKFVPNPYDEYAIEEALARKAAAGEGETVVITLGTDASQETIRSALAMGIDRGVLLQTSDYPDPAAVASLLAEELALGGFDLILMGKMAVDDSQHQVGPQVAERLGMACITAVARLDIEGGTVTAEREIEGAVEVVRCGLPAVITCDKGLNTPRLPALKGIMAAKKKPLDIKPVTAGQGSLEVLSMTLPPDRPPGRIVGEGPDAVPELVRLLRTEAKAI
jgi:electron transfer flavoprotein beta subunit